MENSSKALIIAGAILIAILLISVGMIVMNSAGKPIDEVKNEGKSQAAQIFNSSLTKYAGKNKTPQETRGLLQTISSIMENNTITVFTIRADKSFNYVHVENVLAGISDKKTYTISMGTKNDNIQKNQANHDILTVGSYQCDLTANSLDFSKKKDGYICWVSVISE